MSEPFATSRPSRLLLPALLTLGVVLVGPGTARGVDDPDEPVLALSLEEALRIAVENNLELEVEELASEIAQLDALGSWGAFDPTLSVRGSLSQSEREATSDFSGAEVVEDDSQGLSTSLTVPFRTGGNASISYDRTNSQTNNQFASFDRSTTDIVTVAITQPLLRGAWDRFATTAQREAETGFRQQLERERRVLGSLYLDVYNAYWDLVSARDELHVRALAVELGQRQLEQDERRLEVGAGTEVDVLQARTNVAQQEEARIQAEFALRAAEDALRRLLFQKPSEGVDAFLASWDGRIEATSGLPEVDAVAVDSLDWRNTLVLAIEKRPELEQARLDVEAAEIRLESARSNRRPQLDLELSATGVGFDPEPTDAFEAAAGFDFPEYRGALVFSLPLRNRVARNAERAARAAVRNARLSYDVQELNILSEARAAVRDVRYRRESVVAADTSLAFAQRQLDAEEARYENGLSTTYQVLEFQKDLAEALSSQRAARAAYAKALAKLRHVEGAIIGTPRAMSRGGAGGELMGTTEESAE